MRIAVCDGNAKDIKECKNMLERIRGKYHLDLQIKLYRTVDRLLFDLESSPNQVDLIILETVFPEGNDGLWVTSKLREIGYLNDFLFFTSEVSRMQEAFDVEAVHFLIKGTTSERRFEEVFLKAVKKFEKKSEEVIVLTCASESRSVPLREIRYFEFSKRLILVHYRDEEFEFYSTLGKLESLLGAKGFVRSHKGFLVSLMAIDTITGGDIILKNGQVLPLSRSYSKGVRQAFNNLNAEVI